MKEFAEIQKRMRGISSLLCNTPLLEIEYSYLGEKRLLYAKAEHLNLTGSIKDRMAFHILMCGYERGLLNPGALIVEATSGNTGIAFAAIGRALGHPVSIFMPDWMSEERKNLIRGLGSDVHLVTQGEGGFLGSIRKAEELAARTDGAFLPRQFSNEDNIEAHRLTTGNEIWWQLRVRSVQPDAFVAGVGTGGTIMGVGRCLKEKFPGIKIHPLEPANSPTLSTGCKVGSHRIQGISDEFIPSIVKLQELDEVIDVDDGDAILMAQKLAAEMGLGVGISSGANFLGAVIAHNRMGKDARVVTVFPDDNKKYLTTDLLRNEPVKPGFHSPNIELLGFRSFKRACYTCCDPDECRETIAPDLRSLLPPCPIS